MPKTLCGAIECKHNQNGKCVCTNDIALNSSIRNGQNLLVCQNYELSKRAKAMSDFLLQIMNESGDDHGRQ